MADEPVELFAGHARDLPDTVLAAAVGAALGIVLPDACVAGVAANVRLLEDHLAVLGA
jgi:hypothetical protein